MAKRGQIILQEEINNDDDWTKVMELQGMYVIDVYAEFSGPCVAMTTYLKRIKMELDNDNLHFAIAKCDEINVLKRFRHKSEPHWLFFFDGKLVNVIIGVDASRLTQLIVEEVDQYVKFKNGEIHKEFIPLSKVTDEEREQQMKIENYQKQRARKEKKIRDGRMMKIKERALKQFSYDIQMQTCVMFFPHTVKYIMVEKPLEEGAEELEEPPEPVMIEKRVCEVANSCASKYEELIVIEAKEVKLTEDSLYQLFFMEKEFLESFSEELIEELMNKNVYSVMLSMPTVKHDTTTDDTPENAPVPIDLMGEIELKLSTIIYGGGSPLNPGPDSLADIHAVVDEYGQKKPSVYTPRNPLSKASALTILFNKFCRNHGYVAPQPPSPQYLIIFDINKANTVLPVIEDLEDTVVYYGFFRNADPEKTKLLCKDPELLDIYGAERVGKEAKLVLSVLMDDKDKSLLRLVELGPIYVSPDHEVGIDDAIKFFPYDFDEMEGEIKLWLSQQTAQNEEGIGEEYEFGEGEEGIIEEQDSSHVPAK
ncbi:thioredoxin domain-containing protein 3 homolog [Myzus persicae]|uniref:thioredoxin domain-containing protein 3 homolog n=1 Tax=Myzus persicae TaxID=13164 RepID=UPI000B931D02|nr:thioredoxin domain-containing protein 3 homolog [Myzus persicae]